MPSRIFDHLALLQSFINTRWQPIHVWLVQRRSWSKPGMRWVTVLAIAVLVLAALVYLFGLKHYYLVSQLGVKAADLAVVLYVGSLTPGILKRLNILAMPRASLMLFRREIGDLAFLAALLHASLVRLLPKVLNPVLLKMIPPLPELIGLTTLLVLVPLYVTSNDWMMAKLGPLWHKVHQLTYLVLGLLILHTAWFSLKISLLLAFVGIIEIASFTKSYWSQYLPNQGSTL